MSAKHTPGPVATKLSETRNATRWKVQWPSTMFKQGKCYYATTYPGSELVFIETAVSRRPVGGERVAMACRAAIAKATGEQS